MKNILLIATGGTIASKQTESGLTPAITPEELLSSVPELEKFANISTVQLFNLDSTNMTYTQWVQLACYIRDNYDLYDGFVIAHGTDTMAYGASALSYLIQNSPKPVVLTGAQRSIYERDSDARENLLDAFIYASDDGACGVTVVFGGKVILGTRARKMRTRSYNAFSSVDFPEIAVIRGGKLYYYITEREQGPAHFYDKMDTNVFVLKLIPGMDPGIFDYIADNYRALIIESFGVGGLPYYQTADFSDKIEVLINRGVKVIMTTQVPHEGSDMEIYKVGFRIKKKYEILEAYNMTTETVVCKTMWALAHSNDDTEFRKLFQTSVAKDLY